MRRRSGPWWSARDFQRATGRRLNSKPSLMKVLWLHGARAVGIVGRPSPVRRRVDRPRRWAATRSARHRWPRAPACSRSPAGEPWPVAVELVGDLLPAQRIWAGDPAGVAGGRGVPDDPAGCDPDGGGPRPSGRRPHQRCRPRRRPLRLDGHRRGAHPHGVADGVDADQIEWLTDQDIDVDWSVLPDHQILLAGRLTGLSLERVAAMLGATDRDARRALGEAALARRQGRRCAPTRRRGQRRPRPGRHHGRHLAGADVAQRGRGPDGDGRRCARADGHGRGPAHLGGARRRLDAQPDGRRRQGPPAGRARGHGPAGAGRAGSRVPGRRGGRPARRAPERDGVPRWQVSG